MTYLLWFDDKDTILERAVRGAAAYLAKRGRWPAAIHAHPADLPEARTIEAGDRTIRLTPAPRVLRYHLHLVDGEADR